VHLSHPEHRLAAHIAARVVSDRIEQQRLGFGGAQLRDEEDRFPSQRLRAGIAPRQYGLDDRSARSAFIWSSAFIAAMRSSSSSSPPRVVHGFGSALARSVTDCARRRRPAEQGLRERAL